MRKSLNDSEIEFLLSTVEEYKKMRKPLISAFEFVAKELNRKKNSIRNIYYNIVCCANKDKELADKIKFDKTKHETKCFKKFNKQEEKQLLLAIENKVKQGFSIRTACMQLSNNDPNLMTRYQNKYRNLVKLENESIEKEKVIKFPQREKKDDSLTDEEIKSLFLGIVKLVKRNAIKQADKLMQNKLEVVNNQLRKSAVETDGKEKQIEKLNQKNEELKQEIKKLKQKIIQLRSISIENIKN